MPRKRYDSTSSLANVISDVPNLVDYFFDHSTAPVGRAMPEASPVPLEFTNWRDEQRAWRETAVLFDQSHHMPELFLEGPDALRLLTRLGVNSFETFGPGRAKQFVACNFDGYVIGECILYCLAEDRFELVSGMQLQDWVRFNAETGGYDVTVRSDLHTAENRSGRTRYRYGLDGPNAEAIFNTVVEGSAPKIPFFRTAGVKIAGCEVLALRHGMAGHKGVELSGDYADRETVLDALLQAGRAHGLTRGGRYAYFSAQAEGGWLAYPLPAVYTDPKLEAFRRWLPATSWAARAQLRGSDRATDITHYYMTPWDMGLGHLVKFDHEFVGREALEAMRNDPHRTKVTLVWNEDDVAEIRASMFRPGLPCKYLDMPVATNGFPQCDMVTDSDGDLVGRAGFSGYSANERSMLSIASVDCAVSEPGTQLILRWGDADGGCGRAEIERHRQVDVRVTVAPAPYAAPARNSRGMGIGQ